MKPRRKMTFAILLQFLAAVLSCVTTALPASAHRSQAQTIVAATSSVRAVAQRQRVDERRPIARANESAPPATLSATTPLVAPAGFERIAVATSVIEAPSRASIDHPVARGPPR